MRIDGGWMENDFLLSDAPHRVRLHIVREVTAIGNECPTEAS
jgi:hypothetical protein